MAWPISRMAKPASISFFNEQYLHNFWEHFQALELISTQPKDSVPNFREILEFLKWDWIHFGTICNWCVIIEAMMRRCSLRLFQFWEWGRYESVGVNINQVCGFRRFGDHSFNHSNASIYSLFWVAAGSNRMRRIISRNSTGGPPSCSIHSVSRKKFFL
jgi:hypothetical protein